MDIDKELAERSLVKMTFLRYIETIWMERLRDNPEFGWDYKFSDEEIAQFKKHISNISNGNSMNMFLTKIFVKSIIARNELY